MDYMTYWPTIVALFLGILLIVVGYTLRSRSYGVFILWLGQLTVVGLILLHIIKAVSD
jgi:hypothetical protein